MGRDSLAQGKAAQIEAARHWGVFHDFQFSDQLKPSGITFVHHAVDDVTQGALRITGIAGTDFSAGLWPPGAAADGYASVRVMCGNKAAKQRKPAENSMAKSRVLLAECPAWVWRGKIHRMENQTLQITEPK